MPDALRVFDFDGTLTVPKEGADEVFLRAHQASFAEALGKPLEWVTEAYAVARAIIVANPNDYGWVRNGVIAAPALVDPFVEAHVCCQIILKDLGEDPAAWDGRLEALYQFHYLKHETTFRPETAEVFHALLDQGARFAIVTNSDPNKVRNRLMGLGDDLFSRIITKVFGFARKYDVTPEATNLPERTSFPGLERAVWLRRRHYWDRLVDLRALTNLPWEEITVIGDIAELDLALPVELGTEGRLILGPNTPPPERAWAENHPRVELITDLREIL